jgi:hypothetical protein
MVDPPLAWLSANEWATFGEIREITRIGYRFPRG